MFTIDFTKPWLYKDIIYFNQGNLSTNNTLRCKLITGGSNDFTGGSIACTFKTSGSEISGVGNLVDAKNGIIDIVFPSNALVVGSNKLEILVNRADGGVAQSPPIIYDIWQGLTTGSGVEAESNYPILIQLINTTNQALTKANQCIEDTKVVIVEANEAIDTAYMSANRADIATAKANIAVDNINTAIASGTQDLEVKAAREDSKGVTHDTLKQRLDADLKIKEKSLKDFVIDMNNMKETQDLAYETENGYKVCKNTQNGVVKDLKICGRSLVNLNTSFSTWRVAGSGQSSNQINSNSIRIEMSGNGSKIVTYPNITNFALNKDYTFILNVKSKFNITRIEFRYGDATSLGVQLNTGLNIVKLQPNKQITELRIGNAGSVEIGEILDIENLLILEGDHTQSPPSYFEGIASVGNGNEIEVLTRKEDGNLLNPNFNMWKPLNNDGVTIENNVVKGAPTSVGFSLNYKIFLNKGNYSCKTEKIEGVNARVRVLDLDRRIVFSNIPNNNFIINKEGFYIIVIDNNAKMTNFEVSLPLLFKSEYTPSLNDFKSDKKTILFKDADDTWKPILNLRGIDENNCDIIDSAANKLYENITEIVFNGDSSENWSLQKTENGKSQFTMSAKRIGIKPNSKILSDKYINLTSSQFNNMEVGIFNGSAWGIVVNDVDVTDVQSLKTKLQSNNIKINVQLLESQAYEVDPLDLEAYDIETMFLINSGLIAPPTSFKITSSLPMVVKNILKRVTRVENYIYKANMANFAIALSTLDTKLRLDKLETPQ